MDVPQENSKNLKPLAVSLGQEMKANTKVHIRLHRSLSLLILLSCCAYHSCYAEIFKAVSDAIL